jgi:hypothetical protein
VNPPNGAYNRRDSAAVSPTRWVGLYHSWDQGVVWQAEQLLTVDDLARGSASAPPLRNAWMSATRLA